MRYINIHLFGSKNFGLAKLNIFRKEILMKCFKLKTENKIACASHPFWNTFHQAHFETTQCYLFELTFK